MIRLQTVKAFAAVLICACGVFGCSREEPAESKINPAAPESYMNDPKFMAKVDKQDAAKRAVMKEYAEVKTALAAAVKADPKGSKAEALRQQLVDLEKKYEAVRKETARIIAERLRAPKNQQK